MATIRGKGNNLQKGELFPSVSSAGSITEECVYFHHDALSARSLGIWRGTAQTATKTSPEDNLLRIRPGLQLLREEEGHRRLDPTNNPGMLGSLKQVDGYSAWKLRRGMKTLTLWCQVCSQ